MGILPQTFFIYGPRMKTSLQYLQEQWIDRKHFDADEIIHCI